MKSIAKVFLSFVLVFSILSNTYAFAETKHKDSQQSEVIVMTEENVDVVIEKLEKYVSVTKGGTFELDFKEAEKAGFQTEQLEELVEYLENLNAMALENVIKINKNKQIEIINNGSMNALDEFTTASSDGITYSWHWWGVKATMSDRAAREVAADLVSIAYGYAAVGAGAAFLGALGLTAVTGLTAAYLGNLSNRISAANFGNGVIVNMTWSTAFTVESR